MRKILFTALALGSLSVALNSCAYMQTNKNIREMGTYYIGCELTKDNVGLYVSGGQWYIGAPKARYKRHYPVIHDTVYGEPQDNIPTEKMIEGSTGGMLYFPISAGTASVLQRPDGYSDLNILVSESKNLNLPAKEDLDAPIRHSILATLGKKASSIYIMCAVPSQPGAAAKFFSTLDKYTVDVAGTLIYNVAMPVAAPFKFFSNFIKGD